MGLPKNNVLSPFHRRPVATHYKDDILIPHQLIENPAQLESFAQATRDAEWICFDTEFVGEKRFQTLICLIQITCEAGNFLLDPLRLPNLDPLLDLLRNPKVLKVTHAGENDYRLFYLQYGVLPVNVFDTQIAAGMLGYRYPSGLAKIVSGELNQHLKKGFAVTDWEARPFSNKQLDYALDDVVILEPLWRSLEKKLRAKGRWEWAREECSRMEQESFYYQDPHHEALNSNLILSLKRREQIFLIRMFAWRRSEAERLDHSKNMVLPQKMISQIVKAIRGGKQALLENRRIPDHLVRKYGKLLESLYQQPPTDEELALLKRLPSPPDEDARDEMLLELLYLLMKYRSLEEGISHALVMPRNAIRRMKNDADTLEDMLGSGWRRELLGSDFVNWLTHYDSLELTIDGGRIAIKVPQ
ncbi:MAG: HRDC domain-containing protein [Lewinella sp.]|nr:HRDC domain-containing protein [Lewinella sp.]